MPIPNPSNTHLTNGLGRYDAELVRHVRSPEFLHTTNSIIAETEEGLLANTPAVRFLSATRYSLGTEMMLARGEQTRDSDMPRNRPALAGATLGDPLFGLLPFGEGVLPARLPKIDLAKIDLAKIDPAKLDPSATPFELPLSIFINPMRAGEIGDWKQEELSLVTKYYKPSAIRGIYILNDVSDLVTDSAQLRQLSDIVYRNAGLDRRKRDDTRKQNDDPLLLFRGPVVLKIIDGQWATYAQQSHIRLPYGSLPTSREFLLGMQSAINAGKIAGHTVQITGRLDINFINWAVGQGVDDLGPIPDIEILYNFARLDGHHWRVTLKPARSGFSQKPQQDLASYSSESQLLAHNFLQYLRGSDHRRTFAALATISPLALGPSHSHLAAKPIEVATLGELINVRSAFYHTMDRQLGPEAQIEANKRKGYDWRGVGFRDRDHFHSVLIERIRYIPDHQSFYAPEFFRLTPEEEQTFCERYEEQLYNLCTEERLKVLNARDDDPHHLERLRLGHVGDRHGIALPFDYMVMDFIITMRAKDNFRIRRSERDAVSKDVVKVPDRIGRDYQNQDSEQFFGLKDIPARLAQSKATHSTVAQFIDPLEESGMKKVSNEREIHEIFANIDSENLKRMVPMVIALAKRARRSTDAHIVEAMDVFKIHVKEALMQRRLAIRQLNTAKLARQTTMEELSRKLKAEKVGSPEFTRQMNSAREGLSRDVTDAMKLYQQRCRDLSECCQQTFPKAAEYTHLKLVSIQDQHLVKFVFSVNDKNKTILGEETIGAQGPTRVSHSEELRGCAMFAGGEYIFARYRESFTSYERWRDFAAHRPVHAQWRLFEINDMSGHYEPEAPTLTLARNLAVPVLLGVGLETAGVQLVDRLAPGLRMHGLVEYRF